MKYIRIRFGKLHLKKFYFIPYKYVIEECGAKLGLSKSEVKRLDKQNGIHIEIGQI